MIRNKFKWCAHNCIFSLNQIYFMPRLTCLIYCIRMCEGSLAAFRSVLFLLISMLSLLKRFLIVKQELRFFIIFLTLTDVSSYRVRLINFLNIVRNVPIYLWKSSASNSSSCCRLFFDFLIILLLAAQFCSILFSNHFCRLLRIILPMTTLLTLIFFNNNL